jgi:hypothetical protein
MKDQKCDDCGCVICREDGENTDYYITEDCKVLCKSCKSRKDSIESMEKTFDFSMREGK